MKKSKIIAGRLVVLYLLSAITAFPFAAAGSAAFTPPGSTRQQSFSFAVYGDIQDNHDDGHRSLVRQMAKEPVSPDFSHT